MCMDGSESGQVRTKSHNLSRLAQHGPDQDRSTLQLSCPGFTHILWQGSPDCPVVVQLQVVQRASNSQSFGCVEVCEELGDETFGDIFYHSLPQAHTPRVRPYSIPPHSCNIHTHSYTHITTLTLKHTCTQHTHAHTHKPTFTHTLT